MSYELIIYRFAAAAEVDPETAQLLKRPSKADLVGSFGAQRHEILRQDSFRDAQKKIKDFAITKDKNASFSSGTEGHGRRNSDDLDDSSAIFSMPPPVGWQTKRRPGGSSHLVALLPSDHLKLKIEQTTWSIRIRASVTACALETVSGFPKLWWTFEGVPDKPELDNRLSEDDVVSFFSFVSELEKPLLENLAIAYFNALSDVTRKADLPSKFKLADDRLKIRFADNNGETISALIRALRYSELSPVQLKETPGVSHQIAKQGMLEFERFVNETNTKIMPAINPNNAHPEVELFGVEAVVAQRDCKKSRTISVAGVAQLPGSRTPYDHLKAVRMRRLAEKTESRLRKISASRRVSGDFASREALLLDERLRARSKSSIAFEL